MKSAAQSASANGGPLANQSEQELHGLMALSLNGDAKAYEALLERIATMIRGYLMKSARASKTSPQQVEDLVQDVLLAIHQKRHTYRTDMPVMPWIFSIARYKLIDSIRAQGRTPIVSWPAEDSDEFEAAASVDAAQAGATDRMDVETLLEELPEKQRQILMLAKVEELPLNEISKRMKMSLSAVKVTIHRAMATLRRTQNPKLGGDNENE
jgi:RNA polymerase sigma-70 factor (ECF subfamily)